MIKNTYIFQNKMNYKNKYSKPNFGTETLTRIKRWPSLKEKWKNSQVRIWSGEHEAYWGENSRGYTEQGLKAGVYSFEEAYAITKHCCDKKKIMYVLHGGLKND